MHVSDCVDCASAAMQVSGHYVGTSAVVLFVLLAAHGGVANFVSVAHEGCELTVVGVHDLAAVMFGVA